MPFTTRIAFYKGRRAENPKSRLFDWLICWVTGKPFSHAELLSDTFKVSDVIFDGAHYSGPTATMLSSSIRDGGVRQTWRNLAPGRWVVVEFHADSRPAVEYIKGRVGTPYGIFDLLSFLLPFRVSTSKSDFCSEVVAAAVGKPAAWATDPGTLYEWAMLQAGARELTDEDLLKFWSHEAEHLPF